LPGQPQRDRGRKYLAQCARLRGCTEEHTLTEHQRWGSSNDSGLRMVKWESQSKTPQSLEHKHICCILLIRIVFCHVSKNLPLHCLFYVSMNICFCFYMKIARDVITDLLIFVDIYHFNYTFSHAHIEAHTYKHTCMIST